LLKNTYLNSHTPAAARLIDFRMFTHSTYHFNSLKSLLMMIFIKLSSVHLIKICFYIFFSLTLRQLNVNKYFIAVHNLWVSFMWTSRLIEHAFNEKWSEEKCSGNNSFFFIFDVRTASIRVVRMSLWWKIWKECRSSTIDVFFISWDRMLSISS
jgi:hypothetical protein